jgi:putative transposon-encoded protein
MEYEVERAIVKEVKGYGKKGCNGIVYLPRELVGKKVVVIALE